MKRYFPIIILSILISLALTYTQSFASPVSDGPGVKQTPSVEVMKGKLTKEEKKARVDEKKATIEEKKELREETKLEKKLEKSAKAEKTPKPRIGKSVNFRGTIESVTANDLTVTLKKGGSQAIAIDEDTTFHIPTVGWEATKSELEVGMEVTVHAVNSVRTENNEEKQYLLAKTIHVIPGQPSRTHTASTVKSYEEGSTITINNGDGTTSTYDISGAKILPKEDAVIEEGSIVTLVFANKNKEEPGTVIAVVVHPSKK